MRVAQPVELSEKDRSTLRSWLRDRSTSLRQALRANIVLAAADGKRNDQIAEEFGCARRTVGLWRARFSEFGIDALQRDAPRSGRKPTVSDQATSEILRLLASEKPPGRTRWSTRSMAQAVGVSHSTVSRVWKLHQLEPHLAKSSPDGAKSREPGAESMENRSLSSGSAPSPRKT